MIPSSFFPLFWSLPFPKIYDTLAMGNRSAPFHRKRFLSRLQMTTQLDLWQRSHRWIDVRSIASNHRSSFCLMTEHWSLRSRPSLHRGRRVSTKALCCLLNLKKNLIIFTRITQIIWNYPRSSSIINNRHTASCRPQVNFNDALFRIVIHFSSV